MDEKKRKGRPSAWDERLGNGINKKPRYPVPVWDILDDQRTKKVLNKMALDENYKQQVWDSVKSNDH